jgi:O-antigen/teichoic acid export membrane protein
MNLNVIKLYRVIGIDFIVKVLAIAVTFLLVPVLISVFKKESYGVWVIFFSILQWVTLIDFGVGNGLRNLIPKLIGDKRYSEVNSYLFSGLIVLFIISLIGCIFSLFFANFIFKPEYFGLSFSSEWFESASLIFTFVFFVYLILSIVKPLAYIIHKPYLVSLLALLPNAILLIFVYTVTSYGDIKDITISNLLLVYLFSLILAYASVLTYIIVTNRDVFSGAFKFSFPVARSVLSASGDLFLLQIAAVLIYSMDNFIVAHFFGTESVTDFSVIFKLFGIYPLFISIVIGPLWNRISTNIVERDYLSISKLIMHYYFIFLLSIPLLIIVFYMAPSIFDLWIGQGVINKHNLLPFLLFNITLGWGMIQSQILNAFNIVRIQWIFAILTPIGRIAMVVLLIDYCTMGIESIMWSGFIISLPITILAPIFIKNELSRLIQSS